MRTLTAVAVTLCLTATPASAVTILHPQTPDATTTVTVSKGDTLSTLAADWPGGPYRAAWVNRTVIPNPDLIEVGQTLIVPSRDGRRWKPTVPPRPTVTVSRSSATYTTAPAASDGLNWTALAACESGGNPTAVSSTGTYRGAFQFSIATWQSIGMTGDPIDHPYSVQLAAAQKLHAVAGPGQWPVCGAQL